MIIPTKNSHDVNVKLYITFSLVLSSAKQGIKPFSYIIDILAGLTVSS